ncbi:GNAT family N-acetyltransferase [Aurantimonas sp. VKM B-3413]|uniref:GNAT family N-acetyltransferase n=1 Tax=Aurantimonas sp. VKM B-3413 TaxID=2779401 RepID=UPI001E580E02|nr:GNAT family N-acetyltransferase [Aurantimonas sp. VKM B-3413]MCB8837585.1 GNAT family N-acetyltransferase [Aurantimonas sp. VKM B-3413]
MTTIAAEIRFAEQRDATALAAVHEAAWRGAYAGIIPHRSLTAMIGRRHTAWWSRAIRSGAGILVVDFGGETVGYATLGRNRTAAIAAEGEIYELYLKPAFQGLGFGRRLFEAARSLLGERDLRGLVVWALAENDMALGFYEQLGGMERAEGRECFEGRSLQKIAFVWS